VGGLLTTVQAAPRRGYRRFGVAGGGPLDPEAHALANRAAGNADDSAALECTLAGPVLRFLRPTVFAIAGADLGARLERSDLGSWPVPAASRVLAREGNVLTFAGRTFGCRAYVAFAGGIEVPERLGSRSTDLMGAFGGFRGRALADGDELVLGPPPAGRRPTEGPLLAPGAAGQGDEVTVRVVRGPQDDQLTDEAMARLLNEAYAVRSSSDRVGLRLEGPPLSHKGSGEIVSDGMVPGAIQVPPDGQPIVMLGDGPTTGGYPKIATVVSRDLGLLAQIVPGAGRVRFRAV
jgi:biotin-dependent carboxylase-like uncharacterized protein